MDQKDLAALLAVKKLADVTPEVNQRNPLLAYDEVFWQMSPEVQNRGISGTTKSIDVLKFFFKKSNGKVIFHLFDTDTRTHYLDL